MQSRTPKLLRYMAYLSLLLTAGLLILVICWIVFPYKVIEFNDGDFRVNTKQLYQGEYLSYDVSYCKYTEALASTTISFVDGIIYTIPKDPQAFYEIGCHTKTILLYIPKALPAGKYYLDHVFTFQVNPIREVRVEAKTEMFEVIEN